MLLKRRARDGMGGAPSGSGQWQISTGVVPSLELSEFYASYEE